MNTILLSDDRDLKIFMHPLRQKMLNLLAIKGMMTAKQVADTLAITSSSAKHHILKLVELGAVEVDHTELVHGITAIYYRRTDATISIGVAEGGAKEAVAQNLLKEVQEGFFSKARTLETVQGSFMGDMLTGVVHLTPIESEELIALIRSYIAGHEQKKEGTVPFVYSLVAYHA